MSGCVRPRRRRHAADTPLTKLQVSWIGSADMPLAHKVKIEDARTGQWLRHLDPVTDPIRRIDMGWTMGDWNQLDVGVETVALRESVGCTHAGRGGRKGREGGGRGR